VCSWSLRPRGTGELLRLVGEAGVGAVQLALDPIRAGREGWGETETGPALEGAGVRVLSGMMAMTGEDYSTLESIRRTGGVRLDEHWGANLRAAEENAALARRLGIGLVTFHAGFLPEDRGDPERAVMIERVREIAAAFAAEGVATALETGQESAETLAGVLEELDGAGGGVGVNFDPANMILYGMGEPVAALRRLARWVRQVHIKDAVPSRVPGQWGEERAVGIGSVDWRAFLRALDEESPSVDLVIERESGEDRVGDVRRAREMLERVGAKGGQS
jgi:L-ribulose-5-phosphate 3-epimerase